MAQLNITERQTTKTAAAAAGGESGGGTAVTILDLEGDILFGDGNVTLRGELRRLLGQGKTNILLNLGGVGYVDSSGIGEMVSGLTAAGRSRGQLKFLNPSARLRELLVITKLLNIFEVYEDETKALASFV